MRKQVKKNSHIILGAACITSLLAAGCGSTPAPDPADSQTVSLLAPSAPDNTKTVETETTQSDTDTDTSDTEPAQNNTGADNTKGKWHVLSPDVAAAIDADFEGTVYKIAEDSFFIAPIETEILEDGSLLSGASSNIDTEIPDSALVQVVFDENTHFYIRTIHNGGESYEDSDATFQNITNDQIVSLKGSFENDIFHATEIRISKID